MISLSVSLRCQQLRCMYIEIKMVQGFDKEFNAKYAATEIPNLKTETLSFYQKHFNIANLNLDSLVTIKVFSYSNESEGVVLELENFMLDLTPEEIIITEDEQVVF